MYHAPMRSVLVAAASLLLAGACGNSDDADDADAATESAHVVWMDKATVSAKSAYVSRDGVLNIEWHKVHAAYRRNNAEVTTGAPMLKVGSSWLELVNRAEVVAKGHAYRIEVGSCATPVVSKDDTTFRELTSCDIIVEQLAATPSLQSPVSATMDFKIEDLSALVAVQSDPASKQRVYLRSTGPSLANADPKTSRATWVQAGLDIITPFGVANLDLDAKPAIGYQKSLQVGQLQLVLEIKDAFTGLCDPTCHDLLELELKVKPVSEAEQMPVVLDYE